MFYGLQVTLSTHKVSNMTLASKFYINFNATINIGRRCWIDLFVILFWWHFRAVSSRQWETALLCNDVSHWLWASLESSLHMHLHQHAVASLRRQLNYQPSFVNTVGHICLNGCLERENILDSKYPVHLHVHGYACNMSINMFRHDIYQSTTQLANIFLGVQWMINQFR